MTRFVIDAATLVRIVVDDIPIDATHQLVAPSSIRSEAVSLLFEAVRRGDLTEREALRYHERLTELKMRLLGDRVSRRAAWDLARGEGWASTRDAEYLALTRLQADALATGDGELAEKATGLVRLAPVGALSTPATGSCDRAD